MAFRAQNLLTKRLACTSQLPCMYIHTQPFKIHVNLNNKNTIKNLHTSSFLKFTSDKQQSNPEIFEFKTETKKLLDIVTHSLYSDKEIFIRELISNSSDALEKLRFYMNTSNDENLINTKPFEIILTTNDVDKTFTIQDSGIGMTREELIENLGTIAKSGSLEFLKNENKNENNIIGKFGVGFYSSFVVANKVEVFSKKFDSNFGWKWTSIGDGSFTLEEYDNIDIGTKIVLTLNDQSLEFCNFQTVEKFAEKFSSFVSFPLYIKQQNETNKQINKQEAIWLKQGQINDDEHKQFFRYLSGNNYGNPLYTFTFHSEVPLSIKSIFYVPEEPPSRLFQSKTDVGISLHSKRILIKKSADEIIPKWMFFIKGIIDCDDLPLNVSRENLQNNKLIENLSNTIIQRILRFFIDQAKADNEKYIKFYNGYSYFLKEGLLDEQQISKKHHDTILKLLRFECKDKENNEMISFDEYIEMMKPNQQNIYYYFASDRSTAMSSPYMEQFIKKNRNVILLYEDIDEFVAMKLQTYKDKKFVAIDSSDEDFEPNLEENENYNNLNNLKILNDEQKKQLEEYIKSILGDKISAIKYSERLFNSPAVVTGFLSSSLRKMMKVTMRNTSQAQSGFGDFPVTFELNSSHPIITSLLNIKNANAEVAKMITEQLYDNATIAAGLMEDPRKMLNRLNKIVEIMSFNVNLINNNEKMIDNNNEKMIDNNNEKMIDNNNEKIEKNDDYDDKKDDENYDNRDETSNKINNDSVDNSNVNENNSKDKNTINDKI